MALAYLPRTPFLPSKLYSESISSGWSLFVFFFISFSFGLSCFSATDNTYHNGLTLFFTLCMHSQQNTIFFRESDAYEALFLIGVKIINKREQERICKYRTCLVKTDLVLFEIDTRFAFIPLEDRFHR